MNEINEKYKFLKPNLCRDLKRLGRNQDGGYVVSFNSAINQFGFGPDSMPFQEVFSESMQE